MGTRKPSVTSLKWWISDSIEEPMISRMWSRLLPWPSPPMASWAGQAIFLSSTMTGWPSVRCSRSRVCSTIFSDSYISSMRMRSRS